MEVKTLSVPEIEEKLFGFWHSQVIFSAVQLGVFKELQTKRSAAVLASKLNTNSEALERLLFACASLGLLIKEGDEYINTEASQEFLIKAAPLIGHMSEVMWPLWNHLQVAVREGRATWKEAFGKEENPFAHFDTVEGVRHFVLGAFPSNRQTGVALSEVFDFSSYKHLMDVGGGSGGLAMEVVKRFPNLKATIFDLPVVCEVTDSLLKEHEVIHRVTTHGGDFFDPSTFPERADIISLSRVLHDWPDSDCLRILQTAYNNLSENGVVLITEALLNDETVGPTRVALQSLHMLVATGRGIERSGKHYGELLTQAGFSNWETRPIRMKSGMAAPTHVVIGRK